MTPSLATKPFPFGHGLVLVTGKGGIGKSLVAASLAQAAAESGRRALLIESSAEDQLGPLFGQPSRGHVVAQVAPGVDAINLSAPANFRDYVVKHLGQRGLFDKVFSHRVVQSFINTVPGLAEVMLLGRLYYECELSPAPRYDIVVFDGFASGHFLSLMTTPAAVLQSKLGGPLARETERVRLFLADRRRAGIVYVGVPEDLVVSECLDFLPRLASEAPARLLGVAMNRVPPAFSGADDASDPASVYLRRQCRVAERSMAALAAGLKALPIPMELPIWQLPELGFVDEPLAPGFGASFLKTMLQEPGEPSSAAGALEGSPT